jgi:dimethylglycine dehydrogenase
LIGDFTVSCLSQNSFQLTASYGAQAFHERWFRQHLDPGITLENLSDQRTGFQIAGPKAFEVLSDVCRTPLLDMSFLDVREMTLGLYACLVQRVSYTGDLGFEIYTDKMHQRGLFDVLWTAGKRYGMQPFGMRAMMSLRLDKFFGSWMNEYSPDYTAGETGLDRFIDFDKPVDFIGRAAAEKERAAGSARCLVAFEVDAEDADVTAYEPVWIHGEVQGFCTSGGYSHYAQKSIALALIPRGLSKPGLVVEIEILGSRRPARLIETPLFDPDGARMRQDLTAVCS